MTRRTGLCRLRCGDTLRHVDATVTAYQVRNEAGDRQVHRIPCPEEFNAHDRGGQGCIRRPREDGHESQASEQVHRCVKHSGERVPEACTHVEQGRHFATLEPATQRHRREHSLREPGERRCATVMKARNDGRRPGVRRTQAEPKVVPCACREHERDDRNPAHDRAKLRPANRGLCESADGVYRLGEEHAREPKSGAGEDHLGHEQERERQAIARDCNRGDLVVRVLDAPGGGCPVCDDSGDERGQQRRVLQAADYEHLGCENRPREWRPEDSAETGCYSGHQEHAQLRRVQPQPSAHTPRDASAHLQRRPLAPR